MGCYGMVWVGTMQVRVTLQHTWSAGMWLCEGDGTFSKAAARRMLCSGLMLSDAWAADTLCIYVGCPPMPYGSYAMLVIIILGAWAYCICCVALMAEYAALEGRWPGKVPGIPGTPLVHGMPGCGSPPGCPWAYLSAIADGLKGNSAGGGSPDVLHAMAIKHGCELRALRHKQLKPGFEASKAQAALVVNGGGSTAQQRC